MGTKDSGEHKKFVFNFKRFSLKKILGLNLLVFTSS